MHLIMEVTDSYSSYGYLKIITNTQRPEAVPLWSYFD